MNKPLFPNHNEPAPDRSDLPAAVDADAVWPEASGGYHRPHDPYVLSTVVDSSTGDTKIQLRPSLRAYRRNFTLACTVFTLGALLIVMSSGWSREFIAPGPLSSPHAPLASMQGVNRCAACHDAQNQSMLGWVGSLFGSQSESGKSQSELCMNCHQDSFSKEHYTSPHNSSPENLAKITARITGTTLASQAASNPHGNSEIACSVCHQEHHGGDQLTILTDAQCQTCHSKSFQSFEHGHPEFVNYPASRRSRIAFDHASHFGRHFPEKGEKFECSLCHQPDGFKNVMLPTSFEQSCAKCHNDQILDSSTQGLVLISLPMLDMPAIEKAGMKVGNWPLAATGDFDGSLPPLMRVLLLADAAAEKILSERGPDFHFFELDADNPDDVRQAVDLVWAIKRLLRDLAERGPSELERRFELVLQIELNDRQLDQMISTLDHSAFHTMVNAWLPNLRQELQGSVSQTFPPNRSAFLATGGIEHRNQGAVKTNTSTRSESEEVEVISKFLLASSQRFATKRGELLAENPLRELLAKSAATTASPVAQAAEPKMVQPTPPANIAPSTVSKVNEASPVQQSPVKQLLNVDHQTLFNPLNRASGWYRDDSKFMISYQSSGHADSCLRSWIDFTAAIPNLRNRDSLAPLLKNLLAPSGLGRCQSCHTVDEANSKLVVNWRSEFRDPSIRSFTKFSHAPHLVHSDLNDCTRCHHLDRERENSSSFVGFDPQQVVSNFRPISTTDCITCHQQGRTNSGCMQCHHYHVQVEKKP